MERLRRAAHAGSWYTNNGTYLPDSTPAVLRFDLLWFVLVSFKGKCSESFMRLIRICE
jgi:hypothetical protein